MAIDVSYVSAFGGGALSFLSPCVLPLVPPYLCYMAGVSFESFAEGKDAAARRTLLLSSLLFVLGFTTVFVGLGASATGIGRFLRQYQDILGALAGLVIIAMGLNFLGAQSFVQNLFYGGGLVLAVSISQLLRGRRPMD